MQGIFLNGNALLALALTSPVLAVPFGFVGFLAGVSFNAFFVFFPTGRLVPRWMGLILLLDIIYAFFGNLPSPISPFLANWPGWLYGLVTLVLYGAIIFSQLYRYRRVSTPVQRQQTKWVVFGVTVFLGVFIGLLLLSGIPSLFNTLLLNEVWTITLPIASHQLSEELVKVVQETMRPTHVSLWLCKNEQRRKPNIDV
jgi:predicted membrane-bound dolichyl-phosphate-mannose-protein mannosyltransferase